MAVTLSKIRVGAPDSMLIDAYTTAQIDLGASMGGATLAYNATYLPVEIDQTIAPVAAYKTKEEVIFSAAFLQEQALVLQAALSLDSTLLTSTVAATLVAPSPPTVANVGAAGAVTYTYDIVAVGANGDSIPSTTVSTATGNATLGVTNYNTVTLPATFPAGTLAIKVVRTVGGTTQGLLATVPATASYVYNDQSMTATAYTPIAVAPATPNTDQLFFGGKVFTPIHTFDAAIPKNDGTLLHIRLHLNRVFSGRQVTIDWKRDKVSEVSKVELMALADTSQVVGKQLGSITEEY